MGAAPSGCDATMNMGSEPQLAVAMWVAMMAVMMLPVAAPAALRADRKLPFFAIYFTAWAGFGIACAGLQFFLESRHILTQGLALSNDATAGMLLIAIGAYELTPWKHAFLQACRASQAHGRPYSLACLGAAWALMGTLFVAGVMNYVWVALLALWIAAEKSLSWGGALAAVAGIGFIIWGGLKLLVV